ncbi:peptidylprolyl isomerase [Adhaeribacter pallidiroseus]|uniref:Peptidylprolyl isomerase n=1 Tax=Adhaeribacter pallidiroseus TaxID=2072847 RepID=A0A369QK57_9BACT|nr:peptidylprolyl isomerase [Adhaeribacter pallidiroseus]RDC64025.1 Peptidylprolyl isomerase [Adhaeribacter pallidiroseus]
MNYIFKISFLAKLLPIVGLCLGLATSGQAQQRTAKAIDGIIIKVDNQIILRSELETALAQVASEGQPITPELRCNILRSLLTNSLMLARAEIDSVVVEEDQVNSELDRRMAYFVQQIGSEEKLEEYYNKSLRQLKDDLRRQVKDQLVLQKMQSELTEKITVTPNEVKKYFNQIPKDSLPYFSTEVEIGQIVKLAQIDKKEKDKVRARLEEIKKRIQNGEDFATLAKEFSEDPVSAKDGGNLGFFKKKELVPEYEAASLKLEPGQLSDVIESQFGFHLIQLIERRGEQYNTRHILLKPGSTDLDMEQTAQELEKIRNRILADSISFAKAAKDLSDDAATKNNGGLLPNPQDGSTYIPLDKVDPGIFFTIDTMKVGSITKPLPYRTEDGKQAMRILYLKSNLAPHQANLKDDYQKISAATLNEKRQKAMNTWFNKNKSTVFIDIDPEFDACNILQSINN